MGPSTVSQGLWAYRYLGARLSFGSPSAQRPLPWGSALLRLSFGSTTVTLGLGSPSALLRLNDRYLGARLSFGSPSAQRTRQHFPGVSRISPSPRVFALAR